jgi:hypothetical protein
MILRPVALTREGHRRFRVARHRRRDIVFAGDHVDDARRHHFVDDLDQRIVDSGVLGDGLIMTVLPARTPE